MRRRAGLNCHWYKTPTCRNQGPESILIANPTVLPFEMDSKGNRWNPLVKGHVMTISPNFKNCHLFLTLGILTAACCLCGCPSTEHKSAQQSSASSKTTTADRQKSQKTTTSSSLQEKGEQTASTTVSDSRQTVIEEKKEPPQSEATSKNTPESNVKTEETEKTKSDLPGLNESLALPAEKNQPAVSSDELKMDQDDPNPEADGARQKPRDLGQPLVDKPEALVRLDPKQPVWVDRENKQVVLLGEVCRADYPLEFFATYSNRSYESVMSINVTPRIVHMGLLAIGAEPGHPVQFQPEFTPPTGTEIAIEVRWKNSEGKIQSAPAQHWIRNIATKKELDCNWVFAGSLLTKDEKTGQPYYLADSGELICALNLPTAMLDLPIRSYAALESRLFEAYKEHLPQEGTPTTVLLKPILSTKKQNPDNSSESQQPKASDSDAKPDEKSKP